MATSVDIDPILLEAAVELGDHHSKRTAVEVALTEYVNRHRQVEIVELFGSIDYDAEYDYRKARKSSCACD